MSFQGRKREIMDFLHQEVFDPVLNSSPASDRLKKYELYFACATSFNA
jgi:hypothetical protein